MMAKEAAVFSSQDLIEQLEGARAQIEQRFLDGGSVLVTIIDVLTKLLDLMERVGNSLKEDEAADATARLKLTASMLSELPAVQASRQERVRSIRKTGRILAEHVTSMEETLRYLRTFAMTAKITGAHIPDFSSFAAEIVERIQFATSEVQALSQQIKALETKIDATTDADAGVLEQQFGNIPGIVQRLQANAAEIQAQRHNLSQMTEKVSALARKVQGKVAQTLSAMQIGDITRQRIEHCQSAYTIADAYFTSGEAMPGVSGQDRENVSALVTRLVHGLLTQTATDFDRDTTRIVQNIRSFCGDITALLDLYQAMVRKNGPDAETPMQLMQADLSAARKVVDGIGVAVTEANRLGEGAASTVKTLTTNVETIQLVRRDIQYMALNTNLRCSKLGDEARGINVVTGELRTFSSHLDSDAEAILVNLGELQNEAAGLGATRKTTGEGEAVDLGASIDAALSHIVEAGDSMDTNMEEIQRCGEEVTDKVAHAANGLDFRSGIGETLAFCTQTAGLVPLDEAMLAGMAPALDVISARISKTYTMAAEREIHASVFGTAAPVAANANVEIPDDDDLFAEALF